MDASRGQFADHLPDQAQLMTRNNAVIESFWGRMQTELLNRKRWKTRIELANAIFDYLEIFHNRQRRHSALGMRTPIEFEVIHQSTQPVA
jgi:putative transposase